MMTDTSPRGVFMNGFDAYKGREKTMKVKEHCLLYAFSISTRMRLFKAYLKLCIDQLAYSNY